jgi:hypothetical protein
MQRTKRHNKLCKWFDACPLKRFYEKGTLDKEWIENYCHNDYLKCVRYKLEEDGVFHPDDMMPDGTIKEGLNE